MKTQWRCQDGKSSSLMTSASGKCLEPSKVKCGNWFDGRCERCVGSGLVWLVVSELDTFGHQQLQLYHSDWQWSLTTDTDHHQQLQVSDLCQEVGGQTSRFSSVGGWLVKLANLISFISRSEVEQTGGLNLPNFFFNVYSFACRDIVTVFTYNWKIPFHLCIEHNEHEYIEMLIRSSHWGC